VATSNGMGLMAQHGKIYGQKDTSIQERGKMLSAPGGVPNR
jgi:hypothetical protein